MKRSEEDVDMELALMKEWFDNEQLLAKHFTEKYGFKISTSNISDALFLLLLDNNKAERRNYWHLNICFDDALKLLSDFNFQTLFNEVTTDIILPDELLIEYKVLIKSKGLVWIIHKYGNDPFPSNPHAHQMDNNIKLDLSNGNCYKSKKHVYTINKKNLLDIRTKAERVADLELPTLLI